MARMNRTPPQPPPRRGVSLPLVLVFIGLLALAPLYWQHGHLKQYDMSSLITYSKDAFISSSSGVIGMTRNAMQNSEEVDPPIVFDNKQGIKSSSIAGSNKQSNINADSTIIDEEEGSIIPIDLTINFLHLIDKAPGAPPEPILSSSASSHRSPEDFLPVVVPSDIQFRWRHMARTGANADDLSVTAYKLLVKSIGKGGNIVWDSGRVDVERLITEIAWGGDAPTVGQILQWQVTLWDKQDHKSTSEWSKFAVGPNEGDWMGEWIAHPFDMDTFDSDKNALMGLSEKSRRIECKRWKLRRPLPLFRTKIIIDRKDEVTSALLVVSGLGSFRASVNGVPLSTSGPIDPPFTAYSKRVMYRGFDITPFAQDPELVIGMTMGSGWWDHRPVSGMAKPELLSRGPATIVAEVILTYSTGEMIVLGETGDNKLWQVTRGHIRESDLFTGEMVDLGVQSDMEGWDTIEGWKETITVDFSDPYNQINKWVEVVPYVTDVTLEMLVQALSIKAKAINRKDAKNFPEARKYADPIGKLVPPEIPPVMSMDKIAPDEVHDLGDGRWLFDFAKAFSGMLHFDEGLPEPIVPKSYPRAHGFKKASANGDGFITVIYGESLEMTAGDINRVLVAGLGLHDGGPRHVSRPEGATKGEICFPDDHDGILSQRDVYIVPRESNKSSYAKARQSHFTTHAFRFAEVCCTKEPPLAHALLYRTAVRDWGNFDSSNILINGGYELVKNAMISNMLSVQSDCPHREKLPYGGDLVADSPAALAFFDMSSFYRKTIVDWLESQWSNGAYTETSIWQDLNDHTGIGHGAGETVWASAPPVLTVRHYQSYADKGLLKKSLPHHIRWLDFLDKYFAEEMKKMGYSEDLSEYHGESDAGLGDWLALRSRDLWLTHTGFYMASARALAYIGHILNDEELKARGLSRAEQLRRRIAFLYLKNGEDNFECPDGCYDTTPGPDMGLFSRIVPDKKRCDVLRNYFKRSGSVWPGDEEKLFLAELKNETLQEEMILNGELTKSGSFGWSQWQGFNEGVFGIRYSMKTLSDMGFHDIALRKASGVGFATPEYMMSHNATTMWESFWRSEDLYSRNHPMLGALAEWMPSSAAGVSLYPTTTGGKEALFWPRFGKSASIITFASAEQGSARGDYSIAWKFQDLPDDKSQYNSAIVSVQIRILVPPSGKGILRLPVPISSTTTAVIRSARFIPDLRFATSEAKQDCQERRKAKLGFNYNWEYDRERKEWWKRYTGKALGTPCSSFLFHSSLDKTDSIIWANERSITKNLQERSDETLLAGLYEVIIKDWPLREEVKIGGGKKGDRLGSIPSLLQSNANVGPYCNDASEAEWHVEDGTHII